MVFSLSYWRKACSRILLGLQPPPDAAIIGDRSIANHQVSHYGSDLKSRAIEAKKAALDRLRPLPPEVVQTLDTWFRVELRCPGSKTAYDSLIARAVA